MASPVKSRSAGSLLTAEQAWTMLEPKLAARFATVRRAFIELDTDKDGVIGMKEFRHALEAVGLFLSGPEFRKLWKMFDTTGDGHISYVEFNNKVGRFITPGNPGVTWNRPETPRLKDWQKRAIAKTMARKVKDIEAAFHEIDTDGSGRISHAEFIQALRKLGLHMGDAESYEMMAKYKKARPAGAGLKAQMNAPGDLDGSGGMEMGYEEFRACLTDYMKLADGPEDPFANDGSLKEAEAIIARVLPASLGVDGLMAKFKPYDEFKTKELTYPQFKTALEASGVRLTAPQFEALCRKADPINDGIIDFEAWSVEHSGGRSAGATLHGGIHIYLPWARLGIRPMTDPITGKPYTRQALAERFSGHLGLSVAETKLIQSLVGRKQEAYAAFTAFDRDGSGELSMEEFELALSKMDADLDNSKELVKALFDRIDLNRNGRIEWGEWWGKLGPYMSLADGSLKRIGLEKLSPREMTEMGLDHREVAAARESASQETLIRDLASVYRVSRAEGGAGEGKAAGTPSKQTGPLNAASARLAASGQSLNGGRGGSDDAGSVATAELDLSHTAQKMKKVLGKAWMSVAADIQAKAASKAANAAEATTISKGAVPSELLRDALASKGVPLTSKEVRAIAARYGVASGQISIGPGSPAYVDVEKLFVDATSGSIAAPRSKSTSRVATRR